MTTMRKAAGKVAWAARTTTTVVGLAIMLALVFGAATMALAAVPGDPFKLGRPTPSTTPSPSSWDPTQATRCLKWTTTLPRRAPGRWT